MPGPYCALPVLCAANRRGETARRNGAAKRRGETARRKGAANERPLNARALGTALAAALRLARHRTRPFFSGRTNLRNVVLT